MKVEADGLPRGEVPAAFDAAAAGYDGLVGLNPGYHAHLRISARRLGIAADGRGLRLLDAGCGTGASTAALLAVAPQAQIVAVDASAGMLGMAAAKRWPDSMPGLRGSANIRVLFSEIQDRPPYGNRDGHGGPRRVARQSTFRCTSRAMAHFSYASPDRESVLIVEMTPMAAVPAGAPRGRFDGQAGRSHRRSARLPAGLPTAAGCISPRPSVGIRICGDSGFPMADPNRSPLVRREEEGHRRSRPTAIPSSPRLAKRRITLVDSRRWHPERAIPSGGLRDWAPEVQDGKTLALSA